MFAEGFCVCGDDSSRKIIIMKKACVSVCVYMQTSGN